MSDLAIRVEGLSKRYRIGLRQKPHENLGGVLVDFVKGPLKNLRRLRRLSTFNENGLDVDDVIWALRDVSLEVKRGEVMGIIGPNGAGKTTLLKILARITEPTSGRVEIKGRVSSLLEVGTGFHPELTGRENIFLNASVLGMRRAEIKRQFDEIVDFSGVEKFIDTPVKRYSSGMRVRLAFSVAAHLEPGILLVDEVLSVGDAAFQKKSLGKMGQVASEGRTVLFVSHNMPTIGKLCPTSILLEDGRLVFSGETHDVISRHLQEAYDNDGPEAFFPEDETKIMSITAVRILDHEGNPKSSLDRSRPFRVEIRYRVREPIADAYVTMALSTQDDVIRICNSRDIETSSDGFIKREPGMYASVVEFPGGILNAGTYYAVVGANSQSASKFDRRNSPSFELVDFGDFGNYQTFLPHYQRGVLAMRLTWSTRMIDNT